MFLFATTFAEASQSGVAAMLLFALGMGLLTALTPCVYPMIPITIAVFGAKKVTRRRAMALATCYVAGIVLLYGSLGTAFALAGRDFGSHLGDPRVVVPLVVIFLALAASMFGAFELNLPSGLQQRLARVGGRGFLGAFLMGTVAGLIAAPCTGPPLFGILAYVSTTRNAGYGFSLLSTYALGIGIPFWAIAGLSMTLPKPGPWMEAIKSVFGLMMVAAAFYFLRPIIPGLGRLVDPRVAFLAVALGVVVLGVALGAVHLSFHDRGVKRVRKTAGVALVLLGLFATTNWALAPARALQWHHAEGAAVAEAKSQARPLLVDFMAEWCLPCKELEVKVFGDPRVAAELQRFVLLKVDLTRESDDPALEAIKKKYGADTLPAVRLVSPTGQLLASVNELPTPEAFLEQLARVPKGP